MYRIEFCLDSFTWTDRHDAKRRLQVLLDALTEINRLYVLRHPGTPHPYRAGVRYIREPAGEEEWQEISYTLQKGGGDCEDLATYLAGWEQARGVQARAVPKMRPLLLPDGRIGILFHIVVRYPDGRVEDPSKRLGMKSKHG